MAKESEKSLAGVVFKINQTMCPFMSGRPGPVPPATAVVQPAGSPQYDIRPLILPCMHEECQVAIVVDGEFIACGLMVSRDTDRLAGLLQQLVDMLLPANPPAREDDGPVFGQLLRFVSDFRQTTSVRRVPGETYTERVVNVRVAGDHKR